MDIINYIFRAMFYLCGALLVISFAKDSINNEKNVKDSTLTNGLLFILLAVSI